MSEELWIMSHHHHVDVDDGLPKVNAYLLHVFTAQDLP